MASAVPFSAVPILLHKLWNHYGLRTNMWFYFARYIVMMIFTVTSVVPSCFSYLPFPVPVDTAFIPHIYAMLVWVQNDEYVGRVWRGK